MKTLEEIKATLRRHKPLLREKFKVNQIGVFGSYAKGEESQASDVDILVEFNQPIGWEFVDLKEFLEEILGQDVDLVTVKALRASLRGNILKEVSYA
ncbi:nucleotidyltransferase [candidate division TA06 bacterium B3_TA06]|uniref:Nucleotidyltransferase n=1 Tax=candidate division TA06 bacterium B3_TA06 TaxID=2012487 RepID=A0A532VAI7_UNCT6|nr:MAG: nucleotidyltransferase [candidate division TA06 bacterium B3_TA06]